MNIFFIFQDSDCLICFGSHASSECPERESQHCDDCHVFIRQCSDHTSLCGKKEWCFNQYEHIYVKQPQERCIIGFNSPFRFLKDGSYRKGSEGMDLYSAISGAIFHFKTDQDISLLSTSYVPVRIIIVVKDKVGDNDVFEEKLLLLTSPQRLLVAAEVNKPFDRNAAISNDTTLILCASANNLSLNVTVLPTGKEIRQYDVRYDANQKKFDIPDYLNVNMIAPAPTPTPVLQPQRSLMAIRDFERSGPKVKYCYSCNGVHRGGQCDQPRLENCPECHIPVKRLVDHAKGCNVKQWFVSGLANAYIELPVIRCVISMESPIMYQSGRNVIPAYAGLVLFSSASDAYVKFTSNTEFVLLTTGFTRIRLPFIVHESSNQLVEKLVLFTSRDRTIIAAMGSRPVTEESVLGDFGHNTPLVLYSTDGGNPSLTVKVYSVQNRSMVHQIGFNQQKKVYMIPNQLDVKCNRFQAMDFDAPLPKKKK